MKQSTAERNAQIVHLRVNEGLSLAEIASKYAVSTQQVCNILRHMGVTKSDIRTPKPRRSSFDREPMSETHFLIGLRLGAARSQKDHSRPEVAALFGIPLRRYSQLEDGLVDPTLSEMLKMCEYTEKSLDWLTRPRNTV